MYFKQSISNNLTRKYLKYYFKYLSKSIFPITVQKAKHTSHIVRLTHVADEVL